MDFLDQLMGPVVDAVNGMANWKRSTEMCTPESHAFLYVLFAGWFAIAAAGIYLWRKVTVKTRTQALSTQNQGN